MAELSTAHHGEAFLINLGTAEIVMYL
jgi:hypothetical protein